MPNLVCMTAKNNLSGSEVFTQASYMQDQANQNLQKFQKDMFDQGNQANPVRELKFLYHDKNGQEATLDFTQHSDGEIEVDLEITTQSLEHNSKNQEAALKHALDGAGILNSRVRVHKKRHY